MMALLGGGLRAAAKAIVGLLLIAAAGIAAMAMVLVSSLIVAATLMMRQRVPVRTTQQPGSGSGARPSPTIIDAQRTPYGWTADVPGPRG